jgi:hypothetical protein
VTGYRLSAISYRSGGEDGKGGELFRDWGRGILLGHLRTLTLALTPNRHPEGTRPVGDRRGGRPSPRPSRNPHPLPPLPARRARGSVQVGWRGCFARGLTAVWWGRLKGLKGLKGLKSLHVGGSRFFAGGVGEGPDPLTMGDARFVGGHALRLARRGEGGVADAVGRRR